MTDPRLEVWAKALVGFSAVVRPGNTVAIAGGVAAEPLLRAVYREVVKRGGHPVMMPVFSGLGAELLRHGSDEQIAFIDPTERFFREQADVTIRVLAETNTKAMSGVDPASQALG